MMPKEHDLYCYRGETWKKTLYFEIGDQPLDLSGMSFKAQIRPSQNNTILTAEIYCIVNAAEGKLVLALPAEITSKITVGTYYYDVKMTNESGEVTYYIFGKFIVKGHVTK